MRILYFSRLFLGFCLVLGIMVLWVSASPCTLSGEQLFGQRTTGVDGQCCTGITRNVDCNTILGSCTGKYDKCKVPLWPTTSVKTCSCALQSQTCGGADDVCFNRCDAKCSK